MNKAPCSKAWRSFKSPPRFPASRADPFVESGTGKVEELVTAHVEATGKDIDECIVVLRAAADRLAPGAEARVTLRKQEVAVRDLAIRAEVHPDPEIRKTAGYFQQKTVELHALNRSVEETRIRLITQIDRLEELKVQLEFNRGAGQVGESVKGGQASLDSIQAITANAQRFANDLDGFGRTPAVAIKPAEATNPVEARKRK
jgi:hypothetical protein